MFTHLSAHVIIVVGQFPCCTWHVMFILMYFQDVVRARVNVLMNDGRAFRVFATVYWSS